jgi:ribose-phosphate pyrophosphokinase
MVLKIALVLENDSSLAFSVAEKIFSKVISLPAQYYPTGEVDLSYFPLNPQATYFLVTDHLLADVEDHKNLFYLFYLSEFITKRGGQVNVIFLSPPYQRDVLGSALIYKTLKFLGVNQIAVCNHHQEMDGAGVFDICFNIYEELIQEALLRVDDSKALIVAPDEGAKKRISSVWDRRHWPFMALSKFRKPDGAHHFKRDLVAKITELSSDTCIIVDDLVDTGQTLIGAAKYIRSLGLGPIYGAVVHGKIRPETEACLRESGLFERIFLATGPEIIMHGQLKRDIFFEVLDFSDLLAQKIKFLI